MEHIDIMDTATPVALEAAAALDSLAAYLGVCPTCLGWDDPTAAYERTPVEGRAACPTCGLCSVEWDLAVAIDAVLVDMGSLDRLDGHILELDGEESVEQDDEAPTERSTGQTSRVPRRA